MYVWLRHYLGHCNDSIYDRQKQSNKEGKDQESIQSSTIPDTGYQWESKNPQLDIKKESQEVSPFPAGEHKATINRRAQKHNKHTT